MADMSRLPAQAGRLFLLCAWAALLSLLATSCFELKQLNSFPCGNDGTCPDGYDCNAKKQCVTAASCSGSHGGPTNTDCHGVCVNIETDNGNCGGCDVACAGSDSCCAGHCLSCTGGQVCVKDSTKGKVGSCACPSVGGGTCSVTPQCGCGSGTKCDRPESIAEACVPNGATATGGDCTSSSQCGANATCHDGRCQQFCSSAADCTSKAPECLPSGPGSGLGWSFCSEHCSPLAPNQSDATHQACPAGFSCAIDVLQAATLCVPQDSVGVDQPCTQSKGREPCVAGASCIGTAASAFCRRWCAVNGASSCGNGSSCTAFSPAVYDNQQQLGYCSAANCIPDKSPCGSGNPPCCGACSNGICVSGNF